MLIRFNPEADAELTEACRWYSHNRQDLDLEFMQCIDDVLARVVSNPHFFPVVYRNLRRAVVRRFPFAMKSQLMRSRSLQFSIRVEIPKCGCLG